MSDCTTENLEQISRLLVLLCDYTGPYKCFLHNFQGCRWHNFQGDLLAQFSRKCTVFIADISAVVNS